MPVNLGSSAVTLYLGDQSVTGYLGSQIVTATVPGAPTITFASDITTGWVILHSIPDDGGSPITEYRLYVNGDLVSASEFESVGQLFTSPEAISPEDSLEVSAVNAIGEGPKSEPFIVT